ncbi:hypothetical protein B0G80_4424 [Paraburkholderia sp. BL6669N2]|uniref:hypothetical protein n=1 Tax=Paraburkholderia sp. BL6669N2 TaxID=1938807 RepID=UPI000E27D046|nr:hypothetical protein [Paraburkholderia sp. BL6669N2]REG61571.1 hypothetical protein B0G80_4424 [Paraburkholderia sp. BL6669N2]
MVAEVAQSSSGIYAELHSIAADVRESHLESKKAPIWTLATTFSLLALLVSLGSAAYTAVYTRRKDSRARQQSINDEYWLRKIVSPLVIEPLVKWLLETVGELPADCSEATFSKDAASAYRDTFQAQMLVHRRNLIVLKQLELALFEKAGEHLDDIEDGVLDYCGENALETKRADGTAAQPRGPLVAKIQENMTGILGAVQRFQNRLS